MKENTVKIADTTRDNEREMIYHRAYVKDYRAFGRKSITVTQHLDLAINMTTQNKTTVIFI